MLVYFVYLGLRAGYLVVSCEYSFFRNFFSLFYIFCIKPASFGHLRVISCLAMGGGDFLIGGDSRGGSGDQEVFIFGPLRKSPPAKKKVLKTKIFRLRRAFIISLCYILVLKVRRRQKFWILTLKNFLWGWI